MAFTQIADVVVPAIFTPYMQLLTAEKSAFVRSGVAELNPLLDELLTGGGKTFDIPHFNDLDDVESNVSTDEGIGSNDAVPQKITTGQQTAIRQSRNQVWSAADLSAALAGEDPLDATAALVAKYWVREQQKMLISTLRGVFADNEANDAGDMINDIAIGGAGTVTAVHLFSAEAFIDAKQTMGDFSDDLVAIAMHSVVFARAQKNNLIDFIPDARGETDIPTFQGLRVIVDDKMPALSDGNGHIEYSSYLFGAGSVSMGVGTPRVATEVNREPLAGRGGGQEFLFSRVEWMIHPKGTRFTSVSLADPSPTNAELETASNWDRIFPERKQVKIAELRTNG